MNALRARYPSLKVEVARHGAEAIEHSLEEDEPSLVIASSMDTVKKNRLSGGSLKTSYGKRIKLLVLAEPNASVLASQDVDGLLQGSIDIPALYAAIDKWLPEKGTIKEKDDMIHFHGQPKYSHGKFGILVPASTLSTEEIDPDQEYEIFLKKAGPRKKKPENPDG